MSTNIFSRTGHRHSVAAPCNPPPELQGTIIKRGRFGFGPRMCIGRRFAELELQVLVVKLLQKFKIEYHHEPVGLVTPFLVKPDRDIKMKFSPRI